MAQRATVERFPLPEIDFHIWIDGKYHGVYSFPSHALAVQWVEARWRDTVEFEIYRATKITWNETLHS
jgi:hypothetical protein